MSIKAGVGGLGAVVIVLASSGPAWAQTAGCVRPASTVLSTTSGSPGEEFTVKGSNFAYAPVAIHWGGVGGPVVGTARGPSFTVPVTVPADARRGAFYVVIVTGFQGHERMVTETFEVTGSRTGGAELALSANVFGDTVSSVQRSRSSRDPSARRTPRSVFSRWAFGCPASWSTVMTRDAVTPAPQSTRASEIVLHL